MHEITSIGFMPTTSHRHIESASCSDESSEQERRKEGVEGRFITIAKDGTMCVWNNNLSLHKVIVVSGNSSCGLLQWHGNFSSASKNTLMQIHAIVADS